MSFVVFKNVGFGGGCVIFYEVWGFVVLKTIRFVSAKNYQVIQGHRLMNLILQCLAMFD